MARSVEAQAQQDTAHAFAAAQATRARQSVVSTADEMAHDIRNTGRDLQRTVQGSNVDTAGHPNAGQPSDMQFTVTEGAISVA